MVLQYITLVCSSQYPSEVHVLEMTLTTSSSSSISSISSELELSDEESISTKYLTIVACCNHKLDIIVNHYLQQPASLYKNYFEIKFSQEL